MKMELFDKDCLKNDYQWNGKETQYSIALTDETLLDISSGNEVLCFVNWFFLAHNLTSTSSLHRLEYLLIYIPAKVRRRKEVATWLRKNWDTQFHIKNTIQETLTASGIPGFTEKYLMAKAS